MESLLNDFVNTKMKKSREISYLEHKGVELRVRPLHMQIGRETVRTTKAHSPFRKNLKLPRAE